MLRVASLFSQVLSLIDRGKFNSAKRNRGAERHSKGFSSWDQFVGNLFGQVGGANSLREICGGLATSTGKMIHLGMNQAPKRSTLAYANSHRPWQLYEDVFYNLLEKCQFLAQTHGRKFRFNNPLKSLDSSTIDLCLSVFDWAKFRRTKGAIKLHLLLDHKGCMPSWALVTDGKTHDV